MHTYRYFLHNFFSVPLSVSILFSFGVLDSLYTHGGNGIQGCVSCCEEVVLILAHFDGIQPVADGDEKRIV